MRKFGTRVAIILLLLSFLTANLVFSPTLHAQVPFYQGKSIRIIDGGQAGGLYDLWARLFANHMGKHIPGNPAIIGQNMPGAGSVIAANYIYNVSKPDGFTLGALNPGIYMDQLIGRKEVQFDWARFNWIGTPEQTEWVFITRADSPYKSIEDIRGATEPPKCGATGTGSFLYQVPKLLEETLGIKLNMVTGYRAGRMLTLPLRGAKCTAVQFPLRPFLAASLTLPGEKMVLFVPWLRPGKNGKLH